VGYFEYFVYHIILVLFGKKIYLLFQSVQVVNYKLLQVANVGDRFEAGDKAIDAVWCGR